MKLLENAALEALSSRLSVATRLGGRLVIRIESYSCKMTTSDKKAYRDFGGINPSVAGTATADGVVIPLSPSQVPDSPGSWSPQLHPLAMVTTETCDPKTLFQLIACLNVNFPDYDFTAARSQSFCRQPSFLLVKRCVESTLR